MQSKNFKITPEVIISLIKKYPIQFLIPERDNQLCFLILSKGYPEIHIDNFPFDKFKISETKSESIKKLIEFFNSVTFLKTFNEKLTDSGLNFNINASINNNYLIRITFKRWQGLISESNNSDS